MQFSLRRWNFTILLFSVPMTINYRANRKQESLRLTNRSLRSSLPFSGYVRTLAKNIEASLEIILMPHFGFPLLCPQFCRSRNPCLFDCLWLSYLICVDWFWNYIGTYLTNPSSSALPPSKAQGSPLSPAFNSSAVSHQLGIFGVFLECLQLYILVYILNLSTT